MAQPVPPEAAPEAVDLLRFLYDISGRQTLATYEDQRVLTLEKLPWVMVKQPGVHHPIKK